MLEILAGAYKVCITPPKEMLPGVSFMPIELGGVYQDLFVRCLILDNGIRKMVFLAYDAADMGRTSEIRAALHHKYGIEAENVFFAATHSHEAPSFASDHVNLKGDSKKYNWVIGYGDFIIERTEECVGKALDRLEPAKYGFAKGNSYINVCRDELFENGLWGQGRNFEGPSDKTLGVIKVVNHDGKLIAGLLNYAVHGTACFLKKDKEGEKYLIAGDIPGMVSEYLEERYQEDNAVFLWTSGAAGNQNPIFFCNYLKYNHDKSSELFYDMGYAAWDLCAHTAQTQAIDAIRILNGINELKDTMKICVVDRSVSLPGQRLINKAKLGEKSMHAITGDQCDSIIIEDAPNVELKLKLVTLDDIALLGLNGELVCEIGIRLKEKAPLKNLMIVTHTGERVGYLPDKAGYDNRTLAFYASVVKDGCTEEYMTPVVLEMFNERLKQ